MTQSPRPGTAPGGPTIRFWFAKALAVVFLMQLAVNAIRPTVSYRALAVGADTVQLGLIAAAFALLSLIFAIPIGRAVDRRGEMPFILSGVVLISIVGFALIGVSSIWALFVTQAVLGLGQIMTTVGMQALIANSSASRRDSRFGIFTVVVSLGQLAGPAISGLVGQHVDLPDALGWTGGVGLAGASVFVAAAMAGLVACALAVSVRAAGSASRGDRIATPPEPASLRHSIGRVLGQPNVPHAMFASVAVLSTTDLLVAYLPAYGEASGLSVATVGLLLSARAGAAMVSRVFLGMLTRRLGRGPLLVLSTGLPALALALLPALDAPALLFLALIVAGLGLGIGQPLSLIWVAEIAPKDIRGTAIAVRLSGNRLGQVAIPVLVGGLVGITGVGTVFWALALMLAGSSAVTATGSFAPAEPD